MDSPVADFTFAPLLPTDFLDRTAYVFSERTAVIDGDQSWTYAEFAQRCRGLTGGLAARGIEPGDRVAALCTNSHLMLELHNGVPLRGAVLVPLNIRLAADELAYILEHAGASLIVATRELAELGRELSERVGIPLVEEGDDYEALVAAEPAPFEVTDERSLLAISYTSGTTGRPKGVMYHHRGAYLQALAMAFHTRLDSDSRYLWTLPMFHCDGWCFTWGVTAAGATHVCLRALDPAEIWRLFRDEDITHLCGAPTVLTMIANAPAAQGDPLDRRIDVCTGGAPPSPTLLSHLADQGLDVTHLYGLTETYGPLAINEWKSEWDGREGSERAVLLARQGVGNVVSPNLRVVDLEGRDVPADAETLGEIVARGNAVMLGYYRDEEATRNATVDGWFRTGDLAVMHPDGYVEIKDRGKDVIISGGENISSVEVEQAIDSHPAVLESAVVSQPDEKWGEVPVAYVTLRAGQDVTPEAIVAHVRERLAGFKAPKVVTFSELPKTPTGKIQKNVLRAKLREEAHGSE